MIITVTLNAAIDKYARGAELPPRPAAPHGRADDHAGRQGRQHRPRAEDARPAGHRHRASRAARPAPGSSSSSPRSRSSTTSCASARSRARTRRSIDPTTGEQTEINERGPHGQRAGDRALPRQAALPRARAPSSWSSPARCRAAWTPTSTPAWSASCASSASPCVVDTDGEPLRHAVRAEPDVDLAQRARGRGARRPRVQRRRGPPDRRRARWSSSGAREAIMTLPDGCFACVARRTARRACTACRSIRAARGASPPSARATRSSPATWPPATRAARAAECLRFGVACGAESTQHFGAGLVDPARSSASWPRSAVRGPPGARRGRPEPRTVRPAATLERSVVVAAAQLRASPPGPRLARGLFVRPDPRIRQWR